MSKTILITGASSGIGKATAKYFQKMGWNIIATMRSPENETELTEIENVLVTRLDVLDLESINDAVNEGVNTFGKIDVLLNNAGYGVFGPVEIVPREDIIQQFNTNVIGLLDVTKALLPHFRANKDGVVINVSSIGGKISFPLGALYDGTKFAVEGISEAMTYEMEQIGCKIKIIEPGAISTDFVSKSLDFHNDVSIKEYRKIARVMEDAMDPEMKSGAPASLAAEVIYTAATDGTNQLRYTVGDDAIDYINKRKRLTDQEFIAEIKDQFGLLESEKVERQIIDVTGEEEE